MGKMQLLKTQPSVEDQSLPSKTGMLHTTARKIILKDLNTNQ